jgi:SHS2 domain-containing protein
MYEIIDHTADVGIRVEGASLGELFSTAAEATFDLMIESKRSYIPSIEVPISIEAPNVEQLMVRWLQELLYIFDTRRLVLSKFYIDDIDATHLEGMAVGMKYDSTRHHQRLDIKAVTYHRLRIDREGERFRAEVIFDI